MGAQRFYACRNSIMTELWQTFHTFLDGFESQTLARTKVSSKGKYNVKHMNKRK